MEKGIVGFFSTDYVQKIHFYYHHFRMPHYHQIRCISLFDSEHAKHHIGS